MLRWLFDLPAGRVRLPHPKDGLIRISDRFADVPVQSQFGSTFRFHRDFVGGRLLVINTMYTQCRGSCPTTSQTVKKLRKELSPTFLKNLLFLSVTLDPEVDRPAKLLSYAKEYGAGAEQPDFAPWYFLTGAKADVETLRKSLGFYDLNPRVDADITRHDGTLLFGNCDRDRWSTLPTSLRLPLLLEGIRRVVGTTPEQRFGFALPDNPTK